MSTSTRGACLCGAVTFAVAPPYRWFAHCHCSMCRKHHGTLFGTGLGVARDRLEWLTGADDVVHYRATPAFERPFCRICGSTVPGVSHDEAFLHVPAGLLDELSGAQPRSHIFVASKSPLVTIADALPQHAAYPSGIAAPGIGAAAMERHVATTVTGAISGSCLCDDVAFEVTAVPHRVVNCYCSLCRRRSGAGFTSTLAAPADAFRWLRGATRARRYALAGRVEHPPRAKPRDYAADFCAHCGSPVPSVAAGTALLPAGSIDTPLAALPALHLYVGSKAPWVTLADDGPRFDELPPERQLKDLLR